MTKQKKYIKNPQQVTHSHKKKEKRKKQDQNRKAILKTQSKT